MSKIILQPSASKAAQEHYFDTIQNKVALTRMEKFLDLEEMVILNEIYPSGECAIWGVTPSKINIRKWNRIGRGDVTLFSKTGGIFASAVTTHKTHNLDLAASLWGYDKGGKTWEHIYFLDEVKNHKIPYEVFNKAVGYADKNIIQGFNVLDEVKSRRVLEAFDLDSEVYYPEITDEQYQAILDKLEGLKDTEAEIITKRRLEQAYLKKVLFGNKTIATCACCMKSYPTSFLVTAHIKKRSFCTPEERKDINVVMPMCKFGCDELFEQGYITVENGKFVRLKEGPISQDLKEKLELVSEAQCEQFNNATKEYFQWHRENHS